MSPFDRLRVNGFYYDAGFPVRAEPFDNPAVRPELVEGCGGVTQDRLVEALME